jgi:hypothetical protein
VAISGLGATAPIRNDGRVFDYSADPTDRRNAATIALVRPLISALDA